MSKLKLCRPKYGNMNIHKYMHKDIHCFLPPKKQLNKNQAPPISFFQFNKTHASPA